MSTLFISRAIDLDTPFAAKLAAAGIVIFGKSLLDLQFKPFDEVPTDATWLFFYSANGVKYFEEGIKPNQKLFCTFAALGAAAEQALIAAGRPIGFVGDGKPIATAKKLTGCLSASDVVVFVQASNSINSVAAMLPKRIKTRNLVVYDNQPNPDTVVDLPKFDYLLFTSPMNVSAFTAVRGRFQASQCTIAIGDTTAKALAENGAMDILIAPAPKIDALGDWLIQVIGQKS